jgi:deoxyadenosine/deoxycytidine kinase
MEKIQMKKVVIINGPIGVGKTTVGKLLCNKLNKSAFIEGDWCFDLHPFIANKETKDMAGVNSYENDVLE